jgi:hypothetical protein
MGEDRQIEAARWAIRQAELVLGQETGSRRASRPDELRLRRRAGLYLASARWKLGRGKWRAAIFLAFQAQKLALPAASPPVGKP